jgi:uncharacterized membrane protein
VVTVYVKSDIKQFSYVKFQIISSQRASVASYYVGSYKNHMALRSQKTAFFSFH